MLGGEADPTAPAERLGLADGDALRADLAELLLEEVLLSFRAADQNAIDPGCGELLHLIGDQRLARDLDQCLRAATRGVAETLGFAAGEDDRLHYCLSSRSGSSVSGSAAGADSARPMPS